MVLHTYLHGFTYIPTWFYIHTYMVLHTYLHGFNNALLPNVLEGS